jgi:hypothetical protein
LGRWGLKGAGRLAYFALLGGIQMKLQLAVGAFFISMLTANAAFAENAAPPAAVAVSKTAPVKPESLRLARDLMDKMKVTDQMMSILDLMKPGMASAMKQSQPNWTDQQAGKIVDYAMAEMGASMPNVLLEVAAAYAAKFSDSELKELIRFYESPVGKRMIAETPALTMELQRVGQKMGAEAGVKAVLKMMQEDPSIIPSF